MQPVHIITELQDRWKVWKNYIKLLFHVPYMTQITALNPLMPELNSWCDVQETGVQMKAAQGGH